MPQPGERLRLAHGRYRLEAPIAVSSYGEVWAARSFFGRPLAIKLVRAETMEQAPPEEHNRWVDGLKREAAFLQSLSKEETRHIVRPIDAGEWQGLPVLVMERMAGNLLDHVLALRQEGRRPPLPQIIDWLGQINEALAAIHRHGWRYLDLKPGNLLLARDGKTLKAADFGTNRLRRESSGHGFAGTVGWQAPEQFIPAGRDESGYVYSTDHRSDYFALGLVFYFLVTGGEVPHYAGECQAIFHDGGEEGTQRLRQEALVPLTDDERATFLRCLGAADTQTTWHPGAVENPISNSSRSPAQLALALLETLLAADPAQRPGNGRAIARRLELIRQTFASKAGRRTHAWGRGGGWPWTALALALVSIGLGPLGGFDAALASLSASAAKFVQTPRTEQDIAVTQTPKPPAIYSAQRSHEVLPLLRLPAQGHELGKKSRVRACGAALKPLGAVSPAPTFALSLCQGV